MRDRHKRTLARGAVKAVAGDLVEVSARLARRWQPQSAVRLQRPATEMNIVIMPQGFRFVKRHQQQCRPQPPASNCY